MSHQIHWLNRGVYIYHYDIVNIDELNTILGQLVGDGRYDTSDFEILDFSGITELILHPSNVKVIGMLTKCASRYKRQKELMVVMKTTVYDAFIKLYFSYLAMTKWNLHRVIKLEEAIRILESLDFKEVPFELQHFNAWHPVINGKSRPEIPQHRCEEFRI